MDPGQAESGVCCGEVWGRIGEDRSRFYDRDLLTMRNDECARVNSNSKGLEW